MLPAIKLVLYENGKLIDTFLQETGTQPLQLIKSLEEFQHTANTALTKLIEHQGDIDDDAEESDENINGEDEEVSPKKKKK